MKFLWFTYFPTRQNGLGYTSLTSRLGVSVAPLILLLDNVWTPLPQIIICSVAIMAGLVSLLLPETMNVQLPETIEDIENPRLVNRWLKQGLSCHFRAICWKDCTNAEQLKGRRSWQHLVILHFAGWVKKLRCLVHLHTSWKNRIGKNSCTTTPGILFFY